MTINNSLLLSCKVFIKKVLIGTPSHDGRLDVWYVNSLVNTIKESSKYNLQIDPVYTSFDSLVQRARNSLFKIAVESDYDYLFFIDSDVEWQPDWFFRLLQYSEDVIGAALIKKNDLQESYTCRILNKNLKYNDSRTLIDVEGVGTGFLRFSKKALHDLWNNSEMYTLEDKPGQFERMVCNVEVKDRVFTSEDYVICNKLRNMGYKVWLDPTITINHVGPKKYVGDLSSFMKKLGYR